MELVGEKGADMVKDQNFSTMILNWKSENCHSGFQRKSVNFSNTYYLWIISSCSKKKGLQIKISVHFTQEVMSFVYPSLKTLENNSITVIHVPLVNDQQQLLISFWLQVLSVCPKFRANFFNVLCNFFLLHHFQPWDNTVLQPMCPSPDWPKSYTFLNSIRDLDFCTPSEDTFAIHARDTLVLAQVLIWKGFGDLEILRSSETPCKWKEIIYREFYLGSVREVKGSAKVFEPSG